MTLLLQDPAAKPGTHALVIGVGKYRHLVGGAGTLFPQNDGMKQLSSPPFSAREIAVWLKKEYRGGPKPLASLELLISEESPVPFALPGEAPVAVDPADYAHVRDAIKAVFTRADSHADNRLLIFYCGHGAASGSQMSLLLEDFGEDPNAPFEHAVDFSSLQLGLDRCAAREQCFFIDACRVATKALLDTFEYCGDPIYPPRTTVSPVARYHPTYYAALAGAQAYSLPGSPSFFSRALLRSFRGAGSDDVDGAWKIQTDRLYTGLFSLVRRAAERAGASGQIVTVDDLTRFALHELQGPPLVPVEVSCSPEQRNALAVLAYQGNGAQDRRQPPNGEPWDLDLPEGTYTFSAELPPDGTAPCQIVENVRLPFRPVRIQVT